MGFLFLCFEFNLVWMLRQREIVWIVFCLYHYFDYGCDRMDTHCCNADVDADSWNSNCLFLFLCLVGHRRQVLRHQLASHRSSPIVDTLHASWISSNIFSLSLYYYSSFALSPVFLLRYQSFNIWCVLVVKIFVVVFLINMVRVVFSLISQTNK